MCWALCPSSRIRGHLELPEYPRMNNFIFFLSYPWSSRSWFQSVDWFQPVIVTLHYNLKEQGEDGDRGIPEKANVVAELTLPLPPLTDALF